jgi:hypothetical protein
MKKLIFLLLTAVILTGIVFAAETAHPPWDISLEAALSENNVDNLVVTSDTVLVLANHITVELSSFQAFVVYYESAIRLNSGVMTSMSVNFKQTWTVSSATNYHLRC